MPSVEESLFSRLSTFAGLAALVSTRVYPYRLPQNVLYPAVSYSRISTGESHCMGSDTGIKRARFQVSSWAETEAVAVSVAAQVDLALRRWRGTVLSITVQDTLMEDHTGFWEEDGLVYHIPKDAVVIYQE